jgi:hypothetical protein
MELVISPPFPLSSSSWLSSSKSSGTTVRSSFLPDRSRYHLVLQLHCLLHSYITAIEGSTHCPFLYTVVIETGRPTIDLFPGYQCVKICWVHNKSMYFLPFTCQKYMCVSAIYIYICLSFSSTDRRKIHGSWWIFAHEFLRASPVIRFNPSGQ